MAEIARVRIGAVKVHVNSRPPGRQVFVYPSENGKRTQGVMQLVAIKGDVAVYQRIR